MEQLPKHPKPDGGLLFACASDKGYQPGMTRRQWLTGLAMQGLINSGNWKILKGESNIEAIARLAHGLADGVLRFEQNEE